jgi:hypothetical protein
VLSEDPNVSSDFNNIALFLGDDVSVAMTVAESGVQGCDWLAVTPNESL